MSGYSFKGQSSSGNFQQGGTKGRPITDMGHSDPKATDYLWMEYKVKKGDYLWKLIRQNWNWPEGHNKEIAAMVKMTRAYNKKAEDWRPDKEEVIHIPIVKSSDYQYSYGTKGADTSSDTLQSTVGYHDEMALPSDFKHYSLTQEEVNEIMKTAIPYVVEREYEYFRKQKNWAMGTAKMVGGTLAIVGGIAMIVGTAGVLPLVIGTVGMTLGVTTTGIGMAQTIATAAGEMDAADKIGQFKNAGHLLGKTADMAMGTESMHRVGNTANIIVNMGVGTRAGQALWQKILSITIGAGAQGFDVLENDVLKETALYQIYKDPKLMEDPKMAMQAMQEIETYKDHFVIKKAKTYLERAIVKEVEMRKFHLRMQKYAAAKAEEEARKQKALESIPTIR